MEKPKRRLAAIMFTDIVGYSAMMQKDEIISTRLRNRHREVFVRLTERYGGEILQYYGDGTLSIYPSAAAAVECGVALQKELKKEPPVPIRVGIHTGDITYSNEEVYGDGVNVAARIESLSIPGGVFISEKVFDDIKNHSWLKARPLGAFELKNIQEATRVYAVTNEGVTNPEKIAHKKPKGKKAVRKTGSRRKRKIAAGFLAFFLGVFGAHRFYLGQRGLGILYLGLSMIGMFIIPSLGNLVGMVAIISFVDAILLWSMNRADFDAKYNQTQIEESSRVAIEKAGQKSYLKGQFDIFFKKGKEAYTEYQYEEAITNLVKALEIKHDNSEAHFLLARCYSILEKPEPALAHLDAAVAFGLEDIDRIAQHADLAYLRVQPEYETFVGDGYRLLEELPPLPKEQPAAASDSDLLYQLNQLEQLFADGILNEQEYLQQKQRLETGNRNM